MRRLDSPSTAAPRAPARPSGDASAPAPATQSAPASEPASATADRFQARADRPPPNDGVPTRQPQAPIPQRPLGFEAVPQDAAAEQTVSKSAAPAAPVKDNQTTSSTIHFDEDVDLSSLKANLDVSHTWRGDLVVKLTSPSGKTATLSDRKGGSQDDLKGAFDLSETFKGESTKGDWTLTVEDKAARDEGTLNAWSLEATGAPKEPPKPAVEPVAISDVESRYGWSAGSWQDKLLQAADRKTGSPDGKVTVKELDEYLAAPDDLQFLSSGVMQQERAQVAAGPKQVADFTEGWQRNMAQAADGNHDGSLNSGELNSYLTKVKSAGTSATTQWMPDQKAAPFDSRIADFTKEADFLTPKGGLPNGTLLSKNYMR
ncbi:MAG TPA: proprotein convertase P-domain-containing protein, partial [Myxococcaceae bacterium]